MSEVVKMKICPKRQFLAFLAPRHLGISGNISVFRRKTSYVLEG